MKIRKVALIAAAAGMIFTACNSGNQATEEVVDTDNPFFQEFDTPHGVPAFDKIKTEHYKPAFEAAMTKHLEEIDAIVNNEEEPTFENVMVAMDNAGQMLDRVSSVFFNLTESNTNDEFKALKSELSPMVAAHYDAINLNEGLFGKVKAIFDKRNELNLNGEQMRLLELSYKNFVRNGALLEGEAKERMKAINQRMSELTTAFGEHMLNETNAFELLIEDEKDLAGLPEGVIAGAAETAKEAGKEGKWLFTVQKPSMIPFLTYADNRDLREKIFKGYTMRGDNGNENDNKEILSEIVKLRIEKANLLGFKTHAHYVLDNNMAKNPDNVYTLLNDVWEKALPVAKQEAKELQALAAKEGAEITLMPWDWWYYAEKLRKEKYDLDEEQLRPYFELSNVRNGMFEVANKLFGITLAERSDLPTYHEDAMAYEVKEADGTFIGILYLDMHPRASKRGGAWMTSFRKQSQRNGEEITPVISVVCNFSKPTGDKPALLSFEEVSTFYHEFGHALHGLLSKCTYNTLSGTSVSRDFVELPSQIMENWAAEAEVLKMYAKHYETGEIIPDELVAKLENSSKFNQGFVTVEFMAAAFLDMSWHTLEQAPELDANAFETQAMDKVGLIPEIVVRYRSPYFSHIFAGGYSSGYYGYMWAEVLDADAFDAFKENGIFDQETANAFRTNILERGGSADPMELYKKFRGAEPNGQALLKRRGLI